MRNRAQYPVQCLQQGALVGWQIRRSSGWADVHVPGGHGCRQGYLEAGFRPDYTLVSHPGVNRVRCRRRFCVSRREAYGGGICRLPEAQVRGLAKQHSIPLVDRVESRVRVLLQIRMAPEHVALEPDPPASFTRLAVGNPSQVGPQRLADGAKDLFRVRQGYGAHQVGVTFAGSHNDHSSRKSRMIRRSSDSAGGCSEYMVKLASSTSPP